MGTLNGFDKIFLISSSYKKKRITNEYIEFRLEWANRCKENLLVLECSFEPKSLQAVPSLHVS